MDRYPNFENLKNSEHFSTDYLIRWRIGGSGIAILAIHGGGIEPGTSRIANAIAGANHSFYSFEGIKNCGNRVLHITSNRFDEPTALDIVCHANIIISIHGSAIIEPIVHLGGLDVQVRDQIRQELKRAGFKIILSADRRFRGTDHKNICNLCCRGMGVQIEISRGLRATMFENLTPEGQHRRTKVFTRFTAAVRRAIQPFAFRKQRRKTMKKFPAAHLDHIDDNTAMGGNLLSSGEGATFRVWAPAAREVRVHWGYRKSGAGGWQPDQGARLHSMADGFWGGFLPGLAAGDRYMYYVVGPEGGTEGLKRDPYARDLTDDPGWPQCQCLLVAPQAFSWHDLEFTPPPFHDLIIYQLHIGVWYIPPGRDHGTFLDLIGKLPYLRDLGINAIQPLPVVEFPGMFSLGYNGVDYFSPETDYGVSDSDPALAGYLLAINRMLLAMRPTCKPYRLQDIQGTANQLKMMIDMCHVYGIAVLLDVVYNHAGGDFGDNSIYFFDCRARGNQNDSLYFTDRGWAGGLVFAYWQDQVKQFLIDNARFYLTEYHVDGFRYDEVSVIKDEGGEHGWLFCQYLTDTCRFVKPEAIQIAECWPVQEAIVRATAGNGAGFDAIHNDGLRDAVRDAIGQAAHGAGAFVDIERIARHIGSPVLGENWRAVQCTENHDIVRRDRGWRMPKIADGSDSRSWYACSRSRVALGLTLTAAGIAHIFMGQEFLEDKQWHDEPHSPYQLWWDGVSTGQRPMVEFLRFTREIIAVRQRLKGLRGGGLNVYHAHNDNRVLAFHRWVVGEGHDVVVIASLKESTYNGYELGFPRQGFWQEVFNSDIYHNWVNPWGVGNSGRIEADGGPLHGLPCSARLTLPANSILIFAR